MSIRRRLLLALLAALFFVGLASSGATWYAVHQEAKRLFDYQLEQMALSLRDHTLQRPDAPLGQVLEPLDYDFIVQVWDPRGAVVYLSDRGIMLPAGAGGLQTVRANGEDWRVFTLSRHDKTIQVAAPLSLRSDRSFSMALRILVPLLASIPLFAALIWLVVGRGLQPLAGITQAIRRRAPASLEPLPEGALPQELAPVVRELNALLERLGEALATQKRFTADAAHELRTPLTALPMQIQLVERARSPEDRQAALETLKTGVRRATRLVEQLLAMARLEPEAAGRALDEVDLASLASEAAAALEPLAEAKGVELRLAEVEPARVTGNEQALAMLVRNLADNALRYTPAGGRVALGTRIEEGRAVLEVSDTGPGIPADERARVFDRFYRLPGSTGDGSGLGLAIVRRVAQAHGAEVALDDAPAGGLRVTVRFAGAPLGSTP